MIGNNTQHKKLISLTSKTIKGIGWTLLSQIFSQAVQFTVLIVLARLLSPRSFGLVAMTTVFLNFCRIFQGLGMDAAIIQKKDLDNKQIHSIFWLTIGIGFFLSVFMILLSPLISAFYRQPELIKISMALGVTFFIFSIGSIPGTLLRRQMRFKEISLVTIATAFISGAFSIVLAMKGFEVWALVHYSIIGAFLTSLFFFITTGWKPEFYFDWGRIRSMFSFGANLTGFSFVNYFSRNMDNLLIGRFLGSVALGYYDFSYNILLFPVRQISGVLGEIFFPVLSSVQDDLPLFRRIYTQATFYISAISFPLMTGVFILAPEFVKAVFGPKWTNAIILLRILSLLGMRQSIDATVGWIYLATGKTNVLLKYGTFAFIIIAMSFIIGLHWGVVGVASGYAIAVVFLTIPCFYIAFKPIKLNIWEFFMNFKSTFFISILMGIIVAGSRSILKTFNFGDLSVLVICTITGFVIYISLMWIFKRELFSELKGYIMVALSNR
jgi:PST family polysaccharide transporter